MMDAKMKTLDHIIDMMDEHMLGRAKKPGAATAAPQAAAPDMSVTSTTVEGPKDELDDESARKLMEMYQSDEPVQVNAKY